jgi:hypothetical protein
MADSSELAAIQAENARLIALLETHGIEWRLPPQPVAVTEPVPSRLSTAKKVALFRRLFRGRTDSTLRTSHILYQRWHAKFRLILNKVLLNIQW